MIINEVNSENHGEVTVNKEGTVTIPWPIQGYSTYEFTTQHFFSFAFSILFSHGFGDFYINRPVTCATMTEWAKHLLWYMDGRFAKHPYFEFIIHNMI